MFFFKIFFFLRYKICSSLKKKEIQICNSSRRRWPVSTLETASFEKQIGGNITNVPARIISQDFKIIKGHNRIANIRVWEIKHYNSIQFNLREREREREREIWRRRKQQQARLWSRWCLRSTLALPSFKTSSLPATVSLSLSLSLSLSSLFRPRLHPWMLMLMLLFANCSVPGDKRNGFVSGGRSIEGDGASAPLYQGPLARRNPRHS